jgi:hypothetical protein
MEKLTVSNVVKTQEVQSKFGPQVRSAFKTNEYGERILSAFSKYAIKEGQVIEGTVEEQERDGRTFHNFKFAPRNAAPAGIPKEDLAIINRKLDTLITKVDQLLGVKKGFDAADLVAAPRTNEKLSDGSSQPNFDPEDEFSF